MFTKNSPMDHYKVLAGALLLKSQTGKMLTIPYTNSHDAFLLWDKIMRLSQSNWSPIEHYSAEKDGFMVCEKVLAWNIKNFREVKPDYILHYSNLAEHRHRSPGPGLEFRSPISKEEAQRFELNALYYRTMEKIRSPDEYIAFSASRFMVEGEALVIPSMRHWDTSFRDLFSAGRLDLLGNDFRQTEVQGFVTNKGRFVDRHEAFDIAEKRNQIIHECGSEHTRRLYSENIYPGRSLSLNESMRHCS